MAPKRAASKAPATPTSAVKAAPAVAAVETVVSSKATTTAAVKRSLADWIVLVFFASHIPITLGIDFQALRPVGESTELLAWYIYFSKDFVMRDRPTWFRGIVLAEVLIQLPLFFVFVQAWWHRLETVSVLGGRFNFNMRTTTLLYGAHVATTLLPIMAAVTFHEEAGYTTTHRNTLLAIYSPYLLIPLYLIWRGANAETLFGDQQKKKAAGRKA